MFTRTLHARFFILAAAAGAVLGMPAPLWAAQTGASGPEYRAGSGDRSASEYLAILKAPESDPVARAEAADRLLELARDAKAARDLGEVLADELARPEARQHLLSALARSWSPPPRLFRPLVRLTEIPTNVPAESLLPAIAAYRTQDAAMLLIKLLSVKHPEPVRAAAAEALIGITGRDDLGADRIAWQKWLAQHRALDSVQWRDMLAQSVWRRQQRLAGERAELNSRINDGYRRLYLALPTEGPDRPKLLAQLVLDTTPSLRDLGLDILWREISAGKTIDPLVIEATTALLEAPHAQVRARAAVLVTQFPMANVAERIGAALARETSAEAAASLLLAAARWPTVACIEPALYWLEQSPAEFPSAVDALLAMHSLGLLTQAEHIDRAAAALRLVETSSLTPAACRLLSAIGSDDDRARIAQLLTGPASPARTAAAEALAEYSGFVEPILAAAESDPALFLTAVRAVMLAVPDARTYAALMRLPARSPQEHRDGLVRASRMLPLAELLAVIREVDDDAQMCDALLTRFTEATVEAMPGVTLAEPELLTEAILKLTEARFVLERPNRALAALGTLPQPLPDGVDPARVRRLRVIGLIWTNQIEQAAAEGAPCVEWLDGLELAIGETHASTIIAEIRRRFEAEMNEAEAQRLDDLSARIRNAAMGP